MGGGGGGGGSFVRAGRRAPQSAALVSQRRGAAGPASPGGRAQWRGPLRGPPHKGPRSCVAQCSPRGGPRQFVALLGVGGGGGLLFVCLFCPRGFGRFADFFFFFKITKCRSVREELSGERRWHRELCRRCSLEPALPRVAARARPGESSPPAVGTAVGRLPVDFFFFFKFECCVQRLSVRTGGPRHRK